MGEVFEFTQERTYQVATWDIKIQGKVITSVVQAAEGI